MLQSIPDTASEHGVMSLVLVSHKPARGGSCLVHDKLKDAEHDTFEAMHLDIPVGPQAARMLLMNDDSIAKHPRHAPTAVTHLA